MKNNKILVSDYDGTFYTSEESIKENIRHVKIFRDQGNKFVIATGRTFQDFKEKQKQYNIEYDYLILNHGSCIMDNKDNILYEEFIPKDVLLNTISYLEKMNLKYPYSEDFKGPIIFSNNTSKDISIDNNISKLMIKIDVKSDNELKVYENEFIDKVKEDVNVYYYESGGIILSEIISKKTDKSTMIKYLISNLELGSEVYTIGDSLNDLNMCQDYNGYCMINSKLDKENVIKNKIDEVYNLIQKIRS